MIQGTCTSCHTKTDDRSAVANVGPYTKITINNTTMRFQIKR